MLACSRAARASATVTSAGSVFGRRSITSETVISEFVIDTKPILVRAAPHGGWVVATSGRGGGLAAERAAESAAEARGEPATPRRGVDQHDRLAPTVLGAVRDRGVARNASGVAEHPPAVRRVRCETQPVLRRTVRDRHGRLHLAKLLGRQQLAPDERSVEAREITGRGDESPSGPCPGRAPHRNVDGLSVRRWNEAVRRR